MRSVIATLFALLLSVFLLVSGNGLHGTLISVRAQIEGFSLTQVGLVGAAAMFVFIGGIHWISAFYILVRRGINRLDERVKTIDQSLVDWAMTLSSTMISS